ncbi:MAG: RtcB family protein [Chlamydiales bacterium]
MTIFTIGTVDMEVLAQIKNAMEPHGDYGVLCADNHIGYSVPIGAAIAYKNKISPSGVGYDIACGNKAVRLSCDAEKIKMNIRQIMDEIQVNISFGVGRKNSEKVEHRVFDDPIWKEIPLLSGLLDKAKMQLGTVGSGNHFVDVFIDELNRVWVGAHFGSRGLGHSIATHFINAGGGKDGIHEKPVVFSTDSDLGEQYVRCMELAGRYTYAGRDWVCSRVAKILGGEILEEVHNHHNFAWKEKHFGEEYWVVRKGSTPAFPGQKGFVGGSMGEPSVILEGVEHPEGAESLYSTVHGSGRKMGRQEAKGKIDKKTGQTLVQGKVSKEMMIDWIKKAGVELRGAGVDESPHCYKRLDEVLRAHQNTIRVLHRLTPIGVAMASDKEFDPYKD